MTCKTRVYMFIIYMFLIYMLYIIYIYICFYYFQNTGCIFCHISVPTDIILVSVFISSYLYNCDCLSCNCFSFQFTLHEVARSDFWGIILILLVSWAKMM